MDSRMVPLYYLCSLAGLALVVGGIWLVYKQKIYIDRESKQVTEIETPLGKFKTNVPALVLFALGFVPLIYPIVKSASFAEEVRITGNVRATSYPVQVYAVIQWDSLLQDRDFSLKVPSLRKFGEEYKVLYVAKNVVLEDRAELENQKNREIALPAREISLVVPVEYEPDVRPVPAEFR